MCNNMSRLALALPPSSLWGEYRGELVSRARRPVGVAREREGKGPFSLSDHTPQSGRLARETRGDPGTH